ncbi:MAG: type I restriction endonuclease subunit R [Flavobacteriaceae bacterium]|nr:type I restriction endonuclease subunit R [Flavobacteriaceae bacterium]
MNKQYKPVVECPQTTVVTEFTPNKKRYKDYQFERDLEKEFVSQLQSQGYEHIKISNESDLINNLRKQLEKLNDYKFSDNEWNTFFEKEIANKKYTIKDKTKIIQSDDFIKTLKRKNKTTKNIHLLKKDDIHDNKLQVINQYESDVSGSDNYNKRNRYDVTILLNGFPVVHIELKKRGVPIKEAFNQINRYKRDSFSSGAGLYEYIQIFVVSNGTETKYYSNSIRNAHTNKRTKHHFQFTNWWSDTKNNRISDLTYFTEYFFSKHTILNILTKYCVFTSEQELLVMRPYQIAATEQILRRIRCSSNNKKTGCTEAGGYIWHTTGSGKTLTSFKTAQLATELDGISKVLFVVDRKDLDYQTMKEYDKFEKGAADSTKDTKSLIRQIEDPNSRIIITTIQKLYRFVGKTNKHSFYKKHIVFIFDECHRSQFGKMHHAITQKFKAYHLFGFTGTPIFQEDKEFDTTERVFGDKLHSYTIVDAITDKNVLPFSVTYYNAFSKTKESYKKKELEENKGRVKEIVAYIIKDFDAKTKRNEHYSIKDKRLLWFNSMFTVSSIEMAKKYYLEFKKQSIDSPSEKQLKVATIFSHANNDDRTDEEIESINKLDKNHQDFLKDAIDDFNEMFGTSFDVSPNKFQNYYKEISKRVKNRDIDILIVVNMFLTGFDAVTLNTLWVDKNLKRHNLLQAYSRTNRVLNDVKSHGNIVCFRDLEEETNAAIILFGTENTQKVLLIKSFDDYLNGYVDDEGNEIKGYKDIVLQLEKEFPIGKKIVGETKQKEFIQLCNEFFRSSNILESFHEFQDAKEKISDIEKQDYQSMYFNLKDEITEKRNEHPNNNAFDDIVFELEFIKHIEINVDYILRLIADILKENEKNKKNDGGILHLIADASKDDRGEKEDDSDGLIDVKRAISSSSTLRDKEDVFFKFIESIRPGDDVHESWDVFLKGERKNDLYSIIKEEKLNPEKTIDFMHSCFEKEEINDYGTDFSDCIPPMVRFGESAKKRTEVKNRVFMKLKIHFKIFRDLCT